MKRSISISLAIAFALSACQSGTTVGTPVCKKGQKSTAAKPCVALGEQPESPKPTSTSKTQSAPPTSAPRSTKPAATQPSCSTYKGRVYTVVIKDTTGYKPESVNLLRGDWILFKNDDPTYSHSLTVDKTSFDTGILKPGQQVKKRVLLPVKLYNRWHDRQISYIQGGPLGVNKNERCP